MRTVFIIVLVALFDFLRGDSVNQTAFPIMVKDGEAVQIHCTYKLSSSRSTNLFWYRQYASGSMEFILLKYAAAGTVYETPGALGERFSAEVDSSSQRFTLNITGVLLSDSLVYYCALRQGNSKLVFGSGTKLLVQPKEKSKTAAFVLGSDKDNKEEKARACLITDFSSHNISVHFGGVDVPVVPSVIKGDKQYSVVAFLPESKDRSNFNCNAFVNGNTTEGDNNDIENVCESDVAYVFESDEKLNSLSLMVLGLRVIFLKSIVFNVLMTVRAWMS